MDHTKMTRSDWIRIAEESGAVIVSMRDQVADIIFEPRDLAEYTNRIIGIIKENYDNSAR